MTTIDESTLHQAIKIARRLSPRDRAQLIAVLVHELAEPTVTAAPTDAWARWTALRDDIGQHYPNDHVAKRLEADRRERDGSLRGSLEVTDVHT